METPNEQADASLSPMPDELDAELENFLVRGWDGKGDIPARYEVVAGRVQEILAEEADKDREIDTHSGEQISPLASTPEEIHIEDIIHSLPHLARFAGQSPEMYSVARHSVHVSLEVEARDKENLAAQRLGLVHDGTEAYLSDVPGPVKKGLPGYKHAERRLDANIVEALDLNVTEQDRKLVKKADDTVGGYELAVQFPERHDKPELCHDPKDVDSNADPEELFHQRARKLDFL